MEKEYKDFINKLSIATAHHIYRNGPIEDMHADKNKSINDSDMKVLNKLIVNRLASIFKIILDKDNVNQIKEKYRYDYIEKLANATIKYVFEEGFLKQEVIIKNLDDDEIKILYEFMKDNLEELFYSIFTEDEEYIKKILFWGMVYGKDWDCAEPESLTFKEFLKKLE